jgi:hypothetical protein
MSAQDGVCDGVTPVKFDVWDGIINPQGCSNSPISPVAETPVTVTLAFPVIAVDALLTEAVIVTIVLVVKKLPSVVVPTTPVTVTLALPVIVAEPTAPVEVTPIFVVNKLPNAEVPATPVTETFASPVIVAEPTPPVAVTSKVGLVFQVLVFQALVTLFQPINATEVDIRLSG